MKALKNRPEIELTYADVKALLAFAPAVPAAKNRPGIGDVPSVDHMAKSNRDPKSQVLFRRVPYPDNTGRAGSWELCQAIATDGTVLLVLEGQGSAAMFETAHVAVADLKRYCPKKNGKLWIRASVKPTTAAGVDFYDEDGLLNTDLLPESDVPFPPWEQVLPARIKRGELVPDVREISLDMARCGKLLALVQTAVGCKGVMLRTYHQRAFSKDDKLDVIRFDTEPGTNGMRAEGALCGRRRP